MKQKSPDINQLQKEQLVYIGELLREMRESMTLSYEELAKTTLIRPNLLQAIEAANVGQLPEPVYTRGLIRRYADALGLDGETLASQYFTPSNKEQQRSFWRVPITPQLRPVHLYATYVALIAIAISALSYTLQRTAEQNQSLTLPVLEGETLENFTMPKEGVTAAEPETPSKPIVVSDDPIRIAVKMQDQSWLRVIADNQVAFEGILKAGDVQTWTAKESLKIRAGNAGGVVVSFNEGDAEVLGKPGVVTEVSYPPDDTASLAF
jgi:cytoskeletal protein RodZ